MSKIRWNFTNFPCFSVAHRYILLYQQWQHKMSLNQFQLKRKLPVTRNQIMTKPYLPQNPLIFGALDRGRSRIPHRRGAPTLQGRAPTYIFVKFSKKLHEIEKNLGHERRAPMLHEIVKQAHSFTLLGLRRHGSGSSRPVTHCTTLVYWIVESLRGALIGTKSSLHLGFVYLNGGNTRATSRVTKLPMRQLWMFTFTMAEEKHDWLRTPLRIHHSCENFNH